LHCWQKLSQAHHEAVTILNRDQVAIVSNLLKVKEDTLVEALTKKKTMAGGETVVMSNKMQSAVATRNAMAKCLYAALFDWIVLHINHALLAKPREARAETQVCGSSKINLVNPIFAIWYNFCHFSDAHIHVLFLFY
jgi:myosin-9